MAKLLVEEYADVFAKVGYEAALKTVLEFQEAVKSIGRSMGIKRESKLEEKVVYSFSSHFLNRAREEISAADSDDVVSGLQFNNYFLDCVMHDIAVDQGRLYMESGTLYSVN